MHELFLLFQKAVPSLLSLLARSDRCFLFSLLVEEKTTVVAEKRENDRFLKRRCDQGGERDACIAIHSRSGSADTTLSRLIPLSPPPRVRYFPDHTCDVKRRNNRRHDHSIESMTEPISTGYRLEVIALPLPPTIRHKLQIAGFRTTGDLLGVQPLDLAHGQSRYIERLCLTRSKAKGM